MVIFRPNHDNREEKETKRALKEARKIMKDYGHMTGREKHSVDVGTGFLSWLEVVYKNGGLEAIGQLRTYAYGRGIPYFYTKIDWFYNQKSGEKGR